MLVAFAGASVAARSTSQHLSNAAVSPRQATTADVVAFTVLYTDRSGTGPRSVTVEIDGTPHAMVPTTGTLATGQTYSYRARQTAGKHDAVFAAVAAAGTSENVGGGALWVRVSEATNPGGGGGDPTALPSSPAIPNPTPTPRPTSPAIPNPTPTPRPTNPAVPNPTPTPVPTVPVAVPDPVATPPSVDPAPVDIPEDPTTPDGDTPGTDAVVPPDAAPPGVPEPVASAAAVAVIAAVVIPGDGGGSGGAQGAVSGGPAGGPQPRTAGLYIPLRGVHQSELLTTLAPTIATTTTAVIAWAAFISFGRRRRDTSPTAPPEILAAAAAAPIEAPAAVGIPAIDESLLPRWRRPSLMAARKTDPLRAMSHAETLSFETAAIRPLEGYERRTIAYRLVRLLDGPDEVTAAEIGLLDQGDEVQLVERCGAYWHVLCPDGRDGWIHRMTIRTEDAAIRELYAVPEPAAAAPTDDVDMDVTDILDAYLRARHSA